MKYEAQPQDFSTPAKQETSVFDEQNQPTPKLIFLLLTIMFFVFSLAIFVLGIVSICLSYQVKIFNIFALDFFILPLLPFIFCIVCTGIFTLLTRKSSKKRFAITTQVLFCISLVFTIIALLFYFFVIIFSI